MRISDWSSDVCSSDLGDEYRAAQPPGIDAFRLRGDPPRVMRLSRKTLASIGAVGGIAIGGALLWALQPSAPKTAENLYSAYTANPAEEIGRASCRERVCQYV